jgi:hypothetical protein
MVSRGKTTWARTGKREGNRKGKSDKIGTESKARKKEAQFFIILTNLSDY